MPPKVVRLRFRRGRPQWGWFWPAPPPRPAPAEERARPLGIRHPRAQPPPQRPRSPPCLRDPTSRVRPPAGEASQRVAPSRPSRAQPKTKEPEPVAPVLFRPFAPALAGYAAAEAAWLTCWSQVVVLLGLTSTEESTSSNSKSSVVDSYWIRSITFWALPVFVVPWMLAHWLELEPSPVTSKLWSTSPLSPSCSVSSLTCPIAGRARISAIASIAASTATHFGFLNFFYLPLLAPAAPVGPLTTQLTMVPERFEFLNSNIEIFEHYSDFRGFV